MKEGGYDDDQGKARACSRGADRGDLSRWNQVGDRS